MFFLTGLWHGANWTFVVWGLFHGAFSFLEEFVPSLKKLPRIILHIYTMLVVIVGFVIFRADTLSFALTFIGKMFTGFEFSAASMSFACQQMTPFFLAMLIAAVIGCGPICSLIAKVSSFRNKNGQAFQQTAGQFSTKLKTASEKEYQPDAKENFVQIILYAASFVLLLWCIIRLSGGSYNPFIYFRF